MTPQILLGRAPVAVDSGFVQKLLETLVAELERPRRLPAQTVDHICGTYGIDRADVGSFLTEQLPGLEDYEIDLILSPVFTPTLKDQAVFAELLGRDSVTSVHWPDLIQQLVGRPTRANLTTEDGQGHAVPLRAVTLERFVHRLRLDGTMPEALFQMLTHRAPRPDQPLLQAIARRAIWEHEGRRDILVRYLTSAIKADAYTLGDAVALLKLAEVYEPMHVADLLGRIPRWQQVLEQEINAAGIAKPFFNERVEEMHGGGRDQRQQDNTRLAARQNERAFLARLQQVLGG
ncbi:MAG: hypothetical protein KIS67_13320 [Verrucomicrobiae bacterium]|nr:hypothetical protein [Verrucomicrobiae bacterium]